MRWNDTDWIIMNAVWKRSPATVRQVIEEIGPESGWAYTTVKTMLLRLSEKKILRVRKQGKTSIFEPLITRKVARRSAVRSLIEKAFDGVFGSLLQHIVSDEKMSKTDRRRLAVLLEELDRGGKAGRP